MSWYIYLVLFSLLACLSACLYHFLLLVRKGKPEDLSEAIGEVRPAIVYSFTGGMSPKKKESAYLHLPTYTAGIIYHLGTFLAIALFFFNLLPFSIPSFLSTIFSVALSISGICGIGILIKRILNKELQTLSNPDDYISNILVSGFHFLTAYFLLQFTPIYFIWVSVLLLYLPLGKLKHTIYFFAARYHLGFFYGRRGVWPPKQEN